MATAPAEALMETVVFFVVTFVVLFALAGATVLGVGLCMLALVDLIGRWRERGRR